MTLATFLFFATLTLPALSGGWQQTPVTSAQSNGASTEQKPQSSASSAQSSQNTSKSKSNSSAKSRRHKKKTMQPDCASSAPIAGTATPDPSTGQTSSQKPGTQATTNCPPPKIIVQQGGTKEPSIQLAGSPSPDQATQKRDAVNQLLDATDQNLKKTTGLQLSAEQQDTVSQARQFVEQSKTALAAGDLERARTLAWKAEVLSEDLIKPQK